MARAAVLDETDAGAARAPRATLRRMRSLVVALGVLLVGPLVAEARAGVVYGICGPSVCAVDDATSEREVLLRGSSSGKAYTAVSASASGRQLAFVRSEAVFRAGALGRRPERVGTALRQAAPEVDVRPDGGAISWVDVIQRPDVISGGFVVERNLIVLDTGDPAGRSRIVAVDMMSGGWLGTAPIKQAYGEDGAPWFVCAIDPAEGCGRTVAADPQRALDQASGSPDGSLVVAVATRPKDGSGAPSAQAGAIALFDAGTGRHLRDLARSGAHPVFSPDGDRVAFSRGRDVLTVPVPGGRARVLARGMSSPAWARG
jgi:hypothetical protein